MDKKMYEVGSDEPISSDNESDVSLTVDIEFESFDAADVLEEISHQLYIASNEAKAAAHDLRSSDE